MTRIADANSPGDTVRSAPALIVLIAVVPIGVAGCGASAAPVVTVTQTTTATPESSAPAPALAASTPAPVNSPPAQTSAAVTVVVPNGVGKDYQTAQDLWRAAGLHVAPATDATGANRLPIIDSNWVVLAQDLKAGSKVPIDSFITATVKKYTDK